LAFGALVLVIGLALLAAKYRTSRRHGFVPLSNGPDAGLERAKAQGVQQSLIGNSRPMPGQPLG
jgi:hypothetical protein